MWSPTEMIVPDILRCEICGTTNRKCFRFPKKRFQEWVDFAKLSKERLSRIKKPSLCYLHFQKSDILKTCYTIRLKRDCIPSFYSGMNNCKKEDNEPMIFDEYPKPSRYDQYFEETNSSTQENNECSNETSPIGICSKNQEVKDLSSKLSLNKKNDNILKPPSFSLSSNSSLNSNIFLFQKNLLKELPSKENSLNILKKDSISRFKSKSQKNKPRTVLLRKLSLSEVPKSLVQYQICQKNSLSKIKTSRDKSETFSPPSLVIEVPSAFSTCELLEDRLGDKEHSISSVTKHEETSTLTNCCSPIDKCSNVNYNNLLWTNKVDVQPKNGELYSKCSESVEFHETNNNITGANIQQNKHSQGIYSEDNAGRHLNSSKILKCRTLPSSYKRRHRKYSCHHCNTTAQHKAVLKLHIQFYHVPIHGHLQSF